MPINKVIYGNTTLIDLTQSSLNSASQILSGTTAYGRDGTLLTGTATSGTSGTPAWVWEDTNGLLHFSDSYPGSEPTMVSETLVFIPDIAIVGAAIVGQSRIG